MAKKSFAENITAAKLMADALSNNKGNLPLGISEELITELSSLKEQAETYNTEQEKLKADLKTKTKQLENTLIELQQKYAFIKKRVKLDIPQSQWKEFGIEDKK